MNGKSGVRELGAPVAEPERSGGAATGAAATPRVPSAPVPGTRKIPITAQAPTVQIIRARSQVIRTYTQCSFRRARPLKTAYFRHGSRDQRYQATPSPFCSTVLVSTSRWRGDPNPEDLLVRVPG